VPPQEPVRRRHVGDGPVEVPLGHRSGEDGGSGFHGRTAFRWMRRSLTTSPQTEHS
jgi:hypothetical protein